MTYGAMQQDYSELKERKIRDPKPQFKALVGVKFLEIQMQMGGQNHTMKEHNLLRKIINKIIMFKLRTLL